MKKKHYLLFLLASLFLLTDVVWAQTSATVNGVVIDENGETLPGVSVVEVGTTNGVLTDLNGHYTLKTTSAKPSVSFSYIGYQTTTLPLNGRTKLDVQMKVETKVLDEVVVVGLRCTEESEPDRLRDFHQLCRPDGRTTHHECFFRPFGTRRRYERHTSFGTTRLGRCHHPRPR